MNATKIFLSEQDLPRQWYNIVADLPKPMPPVLHPGTKQPVTPDDFAPLFPMELIKQEASRERWIDIPDEILNRVSRVNIATRDYANDRNATTAIALITFAYHMAGKQQLPHYGSKDIILLKVLAKQECSRRERGNISNHDMWNAPLFELITGEVGERIRATRLITDPG